MATRYITVRAKNLTEAKKFGKYNYAKLGTATYYAEYVTSAKLNREVGLAAGVPGYTVGLTKRKISTTTIRKVKSHQPMGKYKKTSVDRRKKAADFRLLQVSPNVIRWKNGKTETVTANTLKKLQKSHTWAPDF